MAPWHVRSLPSGECSVAPIPPSAESAPPRGPPHAIAPAATPPRLPRGQASTSTAKVSAKKLRPGAVSPGEIRPTGLVARGRDLGGRLRREARPPRARRRQHARVADGVQTRRGTLVASRQEQRQRVQVDRDRPVGAGLLQRDAHQAVGTLLHAFLGDRRTQYVAQQRLPARRVQSARPRRRVQGEPIERCAQRLVVGERVRLEGREATHPLRPCRRRLARDRRSGKVAFGIALAARLILVLKAPEQAAAGKVPLTSSRKRSPTHWTRTWALRPWSGACVRAAEPIESSKSAG